MSDNLNRRWLCQSCPRSFSTEGELAKHVETYRSRVQELMFELQQALAHADSNASDDHRSIPNGGDNHKDLFCPHAECKHKPPYTQLRSLQRHYTSHVRCSVICPSCLDKFTMVRKYATHLPNCLKSQWADDKKNAAKKRGNRLHRLAITELEQRMSAGPRNGDGPIHETQEFTAGRLHDSARTADSELVRDLEGDMISGTELRRVELPSLSRNDSNFEFSTTYAASNSPLLHRYPRGPALLSNPMEWSLAYPTQPLYMTTEDMGPSVLYSEPGMSRSSECVGDGDLEAIYGPSVVAVGVT